MAVASASIGDRNDAPSVLVGGYSALAEGSWMGAAQATDVVEQARAGKKSSLGAFLRIPHLQLSGLLTREFSIAEASAILMASFFLSAVLGAGRQILFNAQFGAGSEASAYYAAFRLPDTLFSLIAGGALSSAMIPVLLSTTREDGDEAGWRLVNLVLTMLLAVFALTVVVGELFAPVFVGHVLAPGFDAHTGSLTVTLTRIMLMQPVILAVGSVAIAVLNSRNQFLLTALSVASHNIGLIAGIIASREHPALGIYGPALGVVAGAVIQFIILLPGLLERHFEYRPMLNFHDDRLREVIRLLIPNGLAVGVLYAGFIVDTAFASKASQTAALPAIQNAFMLVGLPIALLGQAVGQSAFPRLAAYAASAEWKEMKRTVWRALGTVVALAIPTLILLVVLGHVIIRILFVHGKFHAAAGTLTYDVLVSYAIALPAYVATEVITRGLIAMRDTRTPLLTNTMQIIGRAVIMALLVGSVGVLAIPRAFAVMATVETLALGTILFLKMRSRLQGGGPEEGQPSLQAAHT
jgi:putative peptidoglycan lipid II flippase